MKDVILKNIGKIALFGSLCCLFYIIVHTFFIVNAKTRKLQFRLEGLSKTIDTRLRTCTSPELETSLQNASQLKLHLTAPPEPKPIQRTYIFNIFTKESLSDITIEDLLKKQGQAPAPLEVSAPGDTEFIYKGGTHNLALITVRKLCGDIWRKKSFTVKEGMPIGKKKKIGRDTVDFTTKCNLTEIIPQDLKPIVIKKLEVLRDDKGEFTGTATKEEAFMVSSSRIIFKNKDGKLYSLWAGELVNLGTETASADSSKK